MKRRILSTWLALCMVLSMLPATALAADNSCGLNATWELSGAGVLTISGSGRMTDYGQSNAPWYNRRQEVTRVVVGSGIASVGSYAFRDCNQLTGVTLPNSLTAIGNGAFRGCGQLTSIAIPNNVKNIGQEAFSGCSKLTKISIPAGVTALEYRTFSSCDSLMTIDYGGTEEQWNKIWIDTSNYWYTCAKINYAGSPNTQTVCSGNLGGSGSSAAYKLIWTFGTDGVLTISGTGAVPDYSTFGNSPWYGRRKQIAHIDIGSNVSRIGKSSFYDCNALASVTIPGNVASIGDNAFSNCGNLAEVIIQEGVTSIDKNAFSNCQNLTSITIPSSMAVIGNNAFSYCYRLMDVYYAGTEAQWKEMQFNYIFPDACEIHYNTAPPAPAVSYTVTLDPNGGKLPAGAEDEFTVEEGSTVGTLPTPTRTGYKFNGWYTAKTSGKKIISSTKVTADMTLYARWTKSTPTTCTITLNANGGKVTPSSLTVDSGKTYYSKLPTPTRAGYKFSGWYTTKTGGTKITASTKATANKTLYAHWTRVRTYLVEFDPNGGTVNQDMKVVFTGMTYRELPTPTKPNYHFKGWYTAKTGGKKVTASTRVSLNGSQTLYAQWQTAKPTAKITASKWTVTVPPYCELPLYASADTAKVSSVAAESGAYRDITCTKKAVLSNGTTRYYGKVNGRTGWFTYSCEMDLK